MKIKLHKTSVRGCIELKPDLILIESCAEMIWVAVTGPMPRDVSDVIKIYNSVTEYHGVHGLFPINFIQAHE